MNHKHFKVIPTFLVFESDEVYNIFVNVDENLQININIHNALLLNANN